MATTGSVWEGDREDIGSDWDARLAGGGGPAPSPHPPTADRGHPEGSRRRSDATREALLSGCPECGDRAVAEGCESICRGCGLVVAEYRIRHGPEWRHDGETPAGRGRRRCNGQPERPSKNPGWARTRVGTHAERRRASTRGVRFQRLVGLHTRADDYETEVLNHAIPEVKRLCSALDLRGDTVERACWLFRRARSSGFLAHRRIETVAGAAVYVACREHRVPRLPRDVAAALRLTDDDLQGSTEPVDAMVRAFRGFCKADGVHVEPHPLTPLDYVPRFASTLDLSPATGRRGRAIATAAIDAGAVPNRAPGSVAGASLDLATVADGTEATTTDVAAATGYTAETIREVRRRIEASLPPAALDGERAVHP